MQISRNEAAQALADISKASGHIVRLKGYQRSAPHVVLWGIVWLFANTLTQFWPQYAQYAWPIGIGSGVLISALIGMIQRRNQRPGAESSLERTLGRRLAMTSGVMLAFIFSLISIAQPGSQRETTAMVSILFPFLYMCAGIWVGWRVFTIGLVTAAAILIGYFNVQEWFNLWMGVFAGGSLIVGGLWLRAT